MTDGLLQNLAIIMIVAGAVTVIFHRLRQPVVLGYILAGLILGPHVAGLGTQQAVSTLAELGIILLLFSLGLDFNLRRLAKVGMAAFIAAALEILLMIWIGYVIGRAFAWTRMDSLFLGAILAISSTTIIVKVLADLGLSKEPFAELIFGIQIVQDILAVALLAALSSIAATGALSLRDAALTSVSLLSFLTLVLVVGLLLAPRLLRYVNRFQSDEVLLITALGLCFAVSLLALKMGYSVALGAFLIGAIVERAREGPRIAELIAPVRDMFIAIFFVAMGMLIDPRLLVPFALPIVLITIAVVVGKTLTCALGAFVAGRDPKTALKVGLGLAQIGEFSFIIAHLGQARGVTSPTLYPIVVTVSAITTWMTPYLMRWGDPLAEKMIAAAPRPVRNYLTIYSSWTTSHRPRRQTSQTRQLFRRWALQLGLNVLLITAILLLAAPLARRLQPHARFLPPWTGGATTAVWFLALLLALPLLVATARKLRAVARFFAESTVARTAAHEQTVAVRSIVANTIFLTGLIVLGLWVLLLSSTIMPPWPVRIVLLALAALLTIPFWGWFVRLYSQAQIALQETLAAAPPPVAPPQPALHLPPELTQAQLETVELTAGAPAVGHLIRQLQVRSLSGATIVAIRRGDKTLLNPAADLELQAGDQILLLGEPEQLAAGRTLLLGRPQEPPSPAA